MLLIFTVVAASLIHSVQIPYPVNCTLNLFSSLRKWKRAKWVKLNQNWHFAVYVSPDSKSICLLIIGKCVRLHDPRLQEILRPLLRQKLSPCGLLRQPRPAYGDESVAAAAQGRPHTALHAQLNEDDEKFHHSICTRITSIVTGRRDVQKRGTVPVSKWHSLSEINAKPADDLFSWRKWW